MINYEEYYQEIIRLVKKRKSEAKSKINYRYRTNVRAVYQYRLSKIAETLEKFDGPCKYNCTIPRCNLECLKGLPTFDKPSDIRFVCDIEKQED